MKSVRVNLYKNFFSECEKVILQSGKLSASVFIFPSGVHGLRVQNSKGELIILPFQGQQIWSARFCGRDLTMKSAFTQPVPTTDYLGTYGGFLIHCGATSMGVPSDKDTHPLHGELPNIPYEQAYIGIGEDELGQYLVVGGKAQYTVAFSTNYIAEPEIKLYEEATTAKVKMKITNLRSRPMEYMYLCHINFLPVDGSRLVYSAPADREHIKVHMDIPDGMNESDKEALKSYMLRIADHPEEHNVIDPASQCYNPEIVFTVRYMTDDDGYAHGMQVLPEGDAFYVAFLPEQLPVGIRWIARTGDEDALGLILPATAEHKGYLNAKANGYIRYIDANSSVTMDMTVGYLDKREAARLEGLIKEIIGGCARISHGCSFSHCL